MQVVILANHESTKKHPLTLTRPKCLLKIIDKTILEILFENLVEFCGVNDVVLIIGDKGDMIKEHFGSKYSKIKINYVESKEKADVKKE